MGIKKLIHAMCVIFWKPPIDMNVVVITCAKIKYDVDQFLCSGDKMTHHKGIGAHKSGII